MLKSIVLGSNGYLGKHLSYSLKKDGFVNSNYDIHNLAATDVENYSPLNILDKNSFYRLNPDTDYIFMFAGLSGTNEGFNKYDDFISVNETGLLNLLDWMCKTKSRARIVFPSSRLVYKGKKNQLLNENDPKETKTIYALNKLAAENLLWIYQNAFGIDYTIFRICVPYGNLFDNKFSYGTMGFFLNKAQNMEDIDLFGDGLICRTFTHVEDLCKVIIKTVQNDQTKNEIFNIGGEHFSLVEVANMVAKKHGVKLKFVDWPQMALKLETGDTMFDDSKLKAIGFVNYHNQLSKWLAGEK
jgi:UDP-glucose 4-epimerase